MVDITGLTFAASANTTYEVDALLGCASTTTAGVKFAIAFSAAGATGEFAGVGGAGANSANVIASSLGGSSSQSMNTVANTNKPVFIKGFIVVGANAGNITVQGLKNTSGTLTVYIGSRLTVTQL